MDMFGGLTKTSSRIAIAAALGFALGGIAMGSNTAKAADLGGDCCADLEERVAELEATTVRKGNKKVSVTLSGWVIKSVNWWDDGDLDHLIVGDKDYDLGSRFAITGTAQISPGWSAGYNLTILAPSTVFGFGANQIDDTAGTFGDISTLYSYMFIKSDKFGTINWGHLSPASDNPAVLADISGTVIESNGVFFEGNSFFLRPEGGPGGVAGLIGLAWGDFLNCRGLNAGIGVDCWGAAQPAVRYDSPTWAGFSFKASYGNNAFTSPAGPFISEDFDFADIAIFYANDWGNWKVSAAYAFTWIENAVALAAAGVDAEADLHQVGGSIMHVPSGIGIYAMGQWEQTDILPDTDAWYVKPFVKRTFLPLGATVFYGEWGQYNDQMSVAAFLSGFTGSEVERFGAGVVQEIDAAAMHVYARWQHQELDADNVFVGNIDFEDWDLFQAGGIIFF
jgi:predicted porin